MPNVPSIRIRPANDQPTAADRTYVLYWMTAYRRLGWNYALQHAVARCRELGLPLLIFEGLRVDYPWACDRHHRFIMDGMAANAQIAADHDVGYLGWIESSPGEGRGLLAALAESAAIVITDDYPAFRHPAWIRKAADLVTVRMEAVDSSGLIPTAEPDRVFPTAHAFRREMHRILGRDGPDYPDPSPLAPDLSGGLATAAVVDRWPPVFGPQASRPVPSCSTLPINHGIAPVLAGGTAAARQRLDGFLRDGLPAYADRRNHPDEDGTSGLSPYLHYGHISTHEIVHGVLATESWTPLRIEPSARGSRRGWWGVSESTEGFLDELVTWREVGFNMCTRRSDYDRYDSLPEWARRTLADHAADPRPYTYPLDAFEAADTHDDLWNAAQRQLVRDGTIHNYLRMLWGKKILEWSDAPEQALEIMIELNNRYAMDGRDPNSYSGIFWVLGRYDRAWGPERPVFGKIRYMSSDNTRRKLRLRHYLERYQ